MEKLIVLDSIHDFTVKNECFDPKYASMGSIYFFYPALYNEAVRNNVKCITADVYLSQNYENKKAYCITELHTSRTNSVIKKGAIPALCYSFEPPIIARDFYHFIERYSGKFIHSFQFEGIRTRLEKTPTRFHQMYFPVHSNIRKEVLPWREKKFMVLINSNKRAFKSTHNTLGDSIRSTISHLKYYFDKLIDPSIRVREIYLDRIQAMKHFSKYDDFFLYGRGWDEHISGFGQEYQKAALKSWKGMIDIEYEAKLNCMREFKFSICFENCNFPGYVTEKIFDAFLVGCIPIYYGAPDVKNFIPEDAFIDYTRFRNMEELDKYLQSLSEADADKYLKAAADFLGSTAFEKFYVNNVVKKMVDLVLKC